MILVYNKKVIGVGFTSWTQESNGNLIKGVIRPKGEVIDIKEPSYVITDKYMYDPSDPRADENGFWISEEWKQSIEAEKQTAQDKLMSDLAKRGMLK